MAISKIIYKSSEFATPEVWMDATSATATASDILSPKTAMLADGSVTIGTMVYGASNIVSGTFTGSTAGAGLSVSVPYNGSGYPVAVMIYPSNGTQKTGDAITTLVQQYAIIAYSAVKEDVSVAPTYSGEVYANFVSVYALYKGSTSDASITNANRYNNATCYIGWSVNDGLDAIVRFSNSTTMNVWIQPSNGSGYYGFAKDIEYTYQIVYSSSSSGDTNFVADKKTVNFIDYDGAIRYSYTAQEANALSALPPNPTHTGLTAQGWNWTLNEIKAQLTAVPGGDVWVGQMYITTSGDTEIDVAFDDPEYLSPYLFLSFDTGDRANIDWGDGSSQQTTSSFNQHQYATTGKYTIHISAVTGKYRFRNGSGNNYPSILLEETSGNGLRKKKYSDCIKAIRCGSDIRSSLDTGTFRGLSYCEYITLPSHIPSLSNYTFTQCDGLKAVIIPSGITDAKSQLFNNCYDLECVSIPPSMTTIGETYAYYLRKLHTITIPSGITALPKNFVYGCVSLTSIYLPSGITSIGESAFNGCSSLSSLTIPSTVTSIGNDGLRYNYCILAYHFLPTTPPTLGTNVFGGINTDCKIYVPAASVNDYKTASGWSSYASYIEAEPT